MENILVSACLLGINCRYDGKNSLNQEVLDLKDSYNLIPICPETLGGLATPRPAAEIQGSKVVNIEGKDCSLQYEKGSQEAYYIGKLFDSRLAILKERSPSCGSGEIYDGSFTGKKLEGNGITADLFIKKGIRVLGESEIKKLREL